MFKPITGKEKKQITMDGIDTRQDGPGKGLLS